MRGLDDIFAEVGNLQTLQEGEGKGWKCSERESVF